ACRPSETGSMNADNACLSNSQSILVSQWTQCPSATLARQVDFSRNRNQRAACGGKRLCLVGRRRRVQSALPAAQTGWPATEVPISELSCVRHALRKRLLARG